MALFSTATRRDSVYYYYFFLLLPEFFTLALADVFSQEFSDRKSPQISRTLLSILAKLNKFVVLIISTRPLISKTSRPFIKPFGIVPTAPKKIGIILKFMFLYCYFSFQARSQYLSLFLSFFFKFYSGTVKSTIQQVPFFC